MTEEGGSIWDADSQSGEVLPHLLRHSVATQMFSRRDRHPDAAKISRSYGYFDDAEIHSPGRRDALRRYNPAQR